VEVEAERVAAALDCVVQMAVTSEQLRMMRTSLSRVGGETIFTKSGGEAALDQIAARATELADLLAARVERESELSGGKLAAAEVKLETLSRLGLKPTGRDESKQNVELQKRLDDVEKRVEKFVQNRVKPIVEEAQERPGEAAEAAANWARGMWVRLNGGGKVSGSVTPQGLPMPDPTCATYDGDTAVEELTLEIERLERALQEASKARETKLRSGDISSRALLATELIELDARVLRVSRGLAVRTLQLQMEFIYQSLTDEVLDITPESEWQDPLSPPIRGGSSDEIALLVAEYELLADELGPLLPMAEGEGAGAPLQGGLSMDETLGRLAQEIPDMRVRLGIAESDVFAAAGQFSLRKLQLSVKESTNKISDGINFFTRGMRLLGSDVGSAGRMFMRAAVGATLKPREVTALRRTARDLLSFIPFTIILIIPLSPVGHVLVFGFLQKYFPGFFPSQFSSRRQEIMMRYENLQAQLNEVQEQVDKESQEREFELAAAAVARLRDPAGSGDEELDPEKSTAVARLKQLEKQVARAAEESELGELTEADSE